MTGRARTAEYVYGARPCKRGHTGPRYKNGNCVQCLLDREAAKQADPALAAEKRARERARHAANPEKGKERSRAYWQANRDRLAAAAAARYRLQRIERIAKQRAYREANTDKVRETDRRYRAVHLSAIKARQAAYRKKHVERLRDYAKAYSAEHYRRNKLRYRARSRGRRHGMQQATPPWADLSAIAAIYERAAQLTIETGVPMSVEHRIPLKGKDQDGVWVVSGLHVEDNLEIMPLRLNKSRGCRAWSKEQA